MLSFGSTVSAPSPLKPAYIICGSDRPKVRRALARLRRRVIAESGSDLNVALFEAALTPAAAVVEAAATPGLVLGTRLLVVTGAHRYTVKERQALVAYLKEPMPDTVLAVEGETFARDDALLKAVSRVGEVLRYDLPKGHELARWVRERGAAHRVAIGAAEARHLLALAGEEPERLEREIEKLAAYCRGGTAGVADIDAVCSPAIETRVFDLMDAVGHRQRTAAFRCLEELYAHGEDPRAVFAALVGHVRRLEMVLEVAAETSPSEVARKLGVHSFTARKLLEQRSSYDRARIGRALAALADADAALRGRPPITLESSGGVNDGERFTLELALARMLA